MNAVIHETIIKDISDIISDVKNADISLKNIGKNYKNKFKSISAKSSGLVMVFPVIATNNISISTAAMVAKAQERKAVTMLQMLFSAMQITNATNGFDAIASIHKNIDLKTITIDQFMDIIGEGAEYDPNNEAMISKDQYNNILADMREMNVCFEKATSDFSLNSFRVKNELFGARVVCEADDDKDREYNLKVDQFNQKIQQDNINNRMNQDKFAHQVQQNYRNNQADQAKFNQKIQQDNINNRMNQDKFAHQRQQDSINNQLNQDKFAHQTGMDNKTFNHRVKHDERNYQIDMEKLNRDRLRNQLLDTDIKKANELVPSLMIVNFKSMPAVSPTNGTISATDMQVVVGVKAKLYAVPSDAILARLVTKSQDRNWLLKLIKVSTREISFFKDFLFCIDAAKLDAINQSKQGNYFKLLKVLERRAATGRLKRRIGADDASVAAISTMVLSIEDIEYLRKTERLDLENPSIVLPVMELLNLMAFVIVDETLETAKFLYDTGDDLFETLTFNSLERESSDNGYKKIINLMTKVAR